MFEEEEKRVSIEPLPEPTKRGEPTEPTKKKRGRPALSPSRRKNRPKTDEKHVMTEARKKHYKKMHVMRSEKAKQKREQQQQESLNMIVKDKKMGYVVNPVDNGTPEQSLVDASIGVPQNVLLTQFSNLEKQQMIFQHQLDRFGETFNKLDNYLLSVGIKSSDGSGNSDHILMQGSPMVIQHNVHTTPHHGIKDPSPFVSTPSTLSTLSTPSEHISFRQRALMKKF